jgi:PAS domain-containing protein
MTDMIKTVEGQLLHGGADYNPEYLVQLEDFFMNAPVGMLMCDAQGRVARANGAVIELCERADEAAVAGTPVLDLFGKAGLPQDVLRALAEPGFLANNVEMTLRTRGSERAVLVDVNSVHAHGKLLASRWFVRPLPSAVVLPSVERDVDHVLEAPDADRRARFAALQDFFDNAPVGVHFVGLNGIILRSNQQEKVLLGYGETPQEYDGIHVSRIHYDKRKIELLLTRLAESVPVIDEAAFVYKRDGSIAAVRIYSGLRLKGGKFENTRCFLFQDQDQSRKPERVQNFAFPSL